MAKRQKTDTVQLKLRIRESLRRRLETAAKNSEHSLNTEMVTRLENSFLEARNSMLIDAMLGGGDNNALLRAVSAMMYVVGGNWAANPMTAAPLAEAIAKVIQVFTGERVAVDTAFPERDVKGSADQLAWLAVLTLRFDVQASQELTGRKLS